MKYARKNFVSPDIQYLSVILEDIAKGDLQAPYFQKQYTWVSDEMLMLFDSIAKRYPIGYLVILESEKPIEKTMPFGPFQVNPPQNTSANYVLDGYQTLSTLYGVLAAPPKSATYLDWKWNVYYDLKKEIFLHIRPGEKYQPHYFSLRKLLRITDFRAEAQRIRDECEYRADTFVEKAEIFLRDLKNYKIPIVYIRGGDLETATEIFNRLHQFSKH